MNCELDYFKVVMDGRLVEKIDQSYVAYAKTMLALEEKDPTREIIMEGSNPLDDNPSKPLELRVFWFLFVKLHYPR